MHVQVQELPNRNNGFGEIIGKVKNGFFIVATLDTKRVKHNMKVSFKKVSWDAFMINKPKKMLYILWSLEWPNPGSSPIIDHSG